MDAIWMPYGCHMDASQQQKLKVLPEHVWSSSAAETLVKAVVHTFDACRACNVSKRQCCNHIALS